MKYDLIIKNGFIVDGSGNPGFYGDVGIKNGKIIKVGSTVSGDADKIIDAEGNLVSPGFIDPHVHEELIVLNDNKFEVFLKQGVTTIISGNCGHSVTPYSSSNIYEYMYKNGLIAQETVEKYNRNNPKWNNFSEYADCVTRKGTNINMGFLLGHGTIRWSVMGGSKDRKPTLEEGKEIERLVREGMEQGAFGISTGLSYIPSRYADTEELIEVAKIIKEYDGVYASHIRYYLGVKEAVKEAIKIGQESGVRVQVSHLTPTVPEAFDLILEARNNKVEIAADTIPRSTGHCTRKDRLIQFIMATSSSLFDLGIEGVKAALKTEEGRKEIMKDESLFGEDKSNIIIINTDNPELENRSIKDIAAEKGMDSNDLVLDLLADDNDNITFWLGGPVRGDFPYKTHEKNILDNPLVMVGSDTIFGEVDDPYAWYELQRRGAFPIFFNMYLEGGIKVEEIVKRVTSLPAQQFRIKNKGLLTEGKDADISIINTGKYYYPNPDEIDYKDPLKTADGVEYVIVNGKVALNKGKVLESYSGKVILKNEEEIKI